MSVGTGAAIGGIGSAIGGVGRTDGVSEQTGGTEIGVLGLGSDDRLQGVSHIQIRVQICGTEVAGLGFVLNKPRNSQSYGERRGGGFDPCDAVIDSLSLFCAARSLHEQLVGKLPT